MWTTIITPRRARMYLQMAIYYKMWFSVLFYPITLMLLIEKLSMFPYRSSLGRSLHIVSFLFVFITDIVRYYVGTHGNLRRQVFHVTAFIFLSICPLFPSLIYLSFVSEHLVRFDVIAGTCFLVFLAWEGLMALLVLRELLREETTRFVRLREEAKENRSSIDVNHTNTSNSSMNASTSAKL